MNTIMTIEAARRFVREHGVVLESAAGPAPSLVAAIAGEAIRGSWWAHPQGRAIYAVLRGIVDGDDVLRCRLLGGKVTLVDRRLWPAMVRLADRLAPAQRARILEKHLPGGRHVATAIPFPEWVDAALAAEAAGLSEAEARAMFGRWLPADA